MLPEAWMLFNQAILNSIKNFNYQIPEDFSLASLCDSFFVKSAELNFLDDLGSNLKEMLQNIDPSHPEINIFFYHLLGQEVINEISSVVEIANFCNKKKYDSMMPRLKSLLHHFTKNNLFLNGKSIGNPENTNCHIRFLPHKSIWACRDKKKKQILNSNKNLPENTSSLDTLSLYHHNSDKTVDLKKQLLKKRDIFQSLNCNYLIKEINQAINRVDEEIITVNFGFRRITLSTLASVYRKMVKTEDEIFIMPVTEKIFKDNHSVAEYVNCLDFFSVFNRSHAVFDHYGLICSENAQKAFLVGERDTKTFFVGYCSNV
jgi:hypothetical protein